MMLRSPALHPAIKIDVARCAYEGIPIPYGSMAVCHSIAFSLPACTDLALVHSVGCTTHLVYLRHPTRENWLTLERSGFVATENDFGFTKERLH